MIYCVIPNLHAKHARHTCEIYVAKTEDVGHTDIGPILDNLQTEHRWIQ